jgi:hypothetical protein
MYCHGQIYGNFHYYGTSILYIRVIFNVWVAPDHLPFPSLLAKPSPEHAPTPIQDLVLKDSLESPFFH